MALWMALTLSGAAMAQNSIYVKFKPQAQKGLVNLQAGTRVAVVLAFGIRCGGTVRLEAGGSERGHVRLCCHTGDLQDRMPRRSRCRGFAGTVVLGPIGGIRGEGSYLQD